ELDPDDEPKSEDADDDLDSLEDETSDEPATDEPSDDLDGLDDDSESEPEASDDPAEEETESEDEPAEDPYAGLDDDDESPAAEESATDDEPSLDDEPAVEDDPVAEDEPSADDEPVAADDDYPSSDDDASEVAGGDDSDDEGEGAMSTAEDTDLDPEGAALWEKLEAGDYQPFSAGSPTLLPFRDLVQPISEDEPAGDSRALFSLKEKFDDNRKEINPDNWDADDPMRPTDAKAADWVGTIDLAQDSLTNRCKHLQIGSYLLEAMTKLHGFAGLRDSLHLMRLLVTVCWNRLLPEIEDPEEDLERRAGPFNWFDEPTRSALFPNSVRQIPVLFHGDRSFGWQQWKDSQESKRGMKPEMIEQAMLATPRDRIQLAFDDATACLMELQEIGKFLDRKMGSVAPGMTMIRAAISECRQFLQQSLQKKGPAAEAAPAAAAGGGAVVATNGGEYVAGTVMMSGGGAAVEMVRRPVTRDDIYRQLKEVAEKLAQMEPHSPVPYLLERCVTLGSMPFPQLMKALIRDMNVLTEMNRELGIKDEEAPADNNNSGW
ncbi:MAG TPA: type VI secretion system protein TssA, partial [Pirellulales bacterium]